MRLNRDLLDSAAPDIYDIQTRAPGPPGSLPITEDMLLHGPSGHVFGLSQNAGMGWNAAESGRKQFLILSTQGGLRAPDGKPIALGYHTGHWEISLMVQAAADEFRAMGTIPFAGFCSDPCDGRTQGTPGMELSLFSRDAIAMATAVALSHDVFDGALLLGVCDKIVPGLLMGALQFAHLPAVFVPAGPMTSGLSNDAKAKVRQQYAQGLVDRLSITDFQAEFATYTDTAAVNTSSMWNGVAVNAGFAEVESASIERTPTDSNSARYPPLRWQPPRLLVA